MRKLSSISMRVKTITLIRKTDRRSIIRLETATEHCQAKFHIDSALMNRFNQTPSYCTALTSRLDGEEKKISRMKVRSEISLPSEIF